MSSKSGVNPSDTALIATEWWFSGRSFKKTWMGISGDSFLTAYIIAFSGRTEAAPVAHPNSAMTNGLSVSSNLSGLSS